MILGNGPDDFERALLFLADLVRVGIGGLALLVFAAGFVAGAMLT